MRILANDLRVGDALQLNDWTLHVAAVQAGRCTAVRTTEFAFVLHFSSRDFLDIIRAADPHGAAA